MRRLPYTARGIARVSCVRCGLPAEFQWKVCADVAWRALCRGCDVELNHLVLAFWRDPEAEARIARYRQRIAS